MSWTPETNTELAWAPSVPDSALSVIEEKLVVPVISTTSGAVAVDLSTNVIGGRQPYTFSLDLGLTHLPLGTILEEDTGRLLFPEVTNETSEQFFALVIVNDANQQTTSFHFSTSKSAGPLDLTTTPPVVLGYFPDAFAEVAYSLRINVAGGIPPIALVFNGLNLSALGFTFDGAVVDGVAWLTGAYNGVLGDSFDNLVLIQAYNAGSQIGGTPDGTLAVNWNLLL